MHRTLIYIEQEHQDDALQLLAAAALLHADEDHEVHAVLAGSGATPLEGRVDYLAHIEPERLAPYDAGGFASLLAGLHDQHAYDSLLFPSRRLPSLIAARLGAKLQSNVISDVIAIDQRSDFVQIVRSCFGRRDSAVVEIPKGDTTILTLEPGAFADVARPARKTRVLRTHGLEVAPSGIKRLCREDSVDRDIRDSRVLISGGGGIANAFESLQPLAEALNGDISASRAAVDRGLAPKQAQVGQSGKKVSPDLYMAFGIHGAIQHVVALDNAETVISVNTNANAPICSLSDIVVVGDAKTFAQRLLNKIKEEQIDGTF